MEGAGRDLIARAKEGTPCELTEKRGAPCPGAACSGAAYTGDAYTGDAYAGGAYAGGA